MVSYGDIDREIKKDSYEDAKVFRQELVRQFDSLLVQRLPHMKKGNGRFWTVDLNGSVYFYVTFEFPKYLEGDNTLSIFYGVENNYIKSVENMSVQKQRYVSYSYKIHHQLFQFSNVAWNKEKVGYLYWRLLMQQKKIHYYTREQVDYVEHVLFPVAVNQIASYYSQMKQEFHDNTRVLPDLRIKPPENQ